ncbi:MAG: hsp70 family protein [Sandaracinus sp.]|nr:hsp70 family protein [Sandaracinus sp.]MCB9632490.1 hsp70 family protein [Sandaracinus sp.]
MAVESRFLVGIDLGTTHTVVAYADTLEAKTGAPPIRLFEVEQLVAPGEVEARPMLPSARYLPAESELAAGDLALPWDRGEDVVARGVVGQLALGLGAKTPGRLVASAKSWLSHGAVDRTAKILPWGAPSEVTKVSPVEASASYLAHLRAAWDHRFPNAPLATQEVVLTVPASFDEGARALTVQAAKDAGLKVRLVEEPQAAFYAWLDAHRDGLEGALGQTRLAVVVDVGGGTTDLTLIQVELRESGPRLTRVAVGEHLMLGGDNMDLTLAKNAEARLGKTLGAARFTQLVQQCRLAKERLLMPDAPENVRVTVLGSGSKLVGGAQSVTLTRDEVRELVLGGFFPEIGPDARPERRKGGIVEFGLPYVADAAITKHVSAFLARHEELARTAFGTTDLRGAGAGGSLVPDAVLFNGGVFGSPLLQERMRGVLAQWRGSDVAVLASPHPDQAVARGAVAYALARRGVGLRIGGGSARSYFLIVDADKSGTKRGVCILPRGAEEGEEVALGDRQFSLRLGRPVRFHVVATTSDVHHIAAGELVEVDDGDRYKDLPPIAAVLEGDDTKPEIPVTLASGLTEVGTLEVSCVASENRRWKLELQLRGGSEEQASAQRIGQLHPRFAEATERVKVVYGKPKGDDEVSHRDVKRLRAELEKTLGPRESWQTPLLRELFGALLAGMKRRRRSEDHERVWFHLVGYTLRPGFGYPLDEWRIKQLVAEVLKGSVQFVPEAQNWSEYWTMWRRLAGGLDEKTQTALLSEIEWYLEPPSKKPRKRPPGPKRLGESDMIRLAGSLERVPPETKAKIGGWLVKRLDQHDENLQTWWAVGRLGARVPFYGSAHQVVPKHVVMQWLEIALRFDWRDAPEAAFAATSLARVSGDRERDLDEPIRKRVAERLMMSAQPESWQKMVLEVTQLEEADERRIFGDALPPGLRLLE